MTKHRQTKHRTHTLFVPVTIRFFEPVTRLEAADKFNAANIGRYLERDAQGATGFDAADIVIGRAEDYS